MLTVSSMTSAAMIDRLARLFATHGLPDIIVSDNGTPFTSREFQAFCVDNAVRNITVAPCHPTSNGRAERIVEDTKHALK